MCSTPGCNGDTSLGTLPRIARRQPRNFKFPFSNSSLARQPRTRTGRQRRLQCWSCGSLFNRDTARCDKFTMDREEQVMSCGEGEACMLYTWMKSKSEIGNHHNLSHLLCLGWMFQVLIVNASLPTSYLAILTSPSLLSPPAPCQGLSRTPGPPSGPVSALRTIVMKFKKVRGEIIFQKYL